MFKGYEYSFKHAQGRPALAEVRAASPAFLNLPTIDRKVPAIYSMPVHPSVVLFARRLAEVGALRDTDIGVGSIEEVIATVVRREMVHHLGSTQTFQLSTHISDGIAMHYQDLDDPLSAGAMAEPEERIHFTMDIALSPWIIVGPKIEALEAIHKGLGETVYAILCAAAQGSLNLFTFNRLMWGPEDIYRFSERRWHEDYAKRNGLATTLEDELDEEEAASLLSREEVMVNLPYNWFDEPQIRFSPRFMKTIRNRATTPTWAKDILDLCFSLADAYREGAGKLGSIAYQELEPAYSLAILRFSEDDAMQRAVDDFDQHLNSGSDYYSESAHIELVSLTDAADFKKWWDGMLAGCRLIKTIDAMLKALDQPQT